MPKLVADIRQARPVLEQLRGEGVPEIVNAKVAQAGPLDRGEEMAGIHVAMIQDRAGFRSEDQVVGKVRLSLEICIQHTRIAGFEQCTPELPREINAPGLFAFGARELPMYPIAANPNESILIFLVPSKLDVTPTKGRGFTPTHPSAQESEKEQMKIFVNGFEK